MDEYSLSSISNNGSFLAFPMINKKQKLLDWINTINEPLCLLVSEMNNLRDGRVFVEIMRHFLQRENMLNQFINDINSSDKMMPSQRVLMVITILSKVDNSKLLKKKFDKFYNNYSRLFKDDDFMLDFVALLRIIFEKEIDNEIEEDQPKALIQKKDEEGFVVQSGNFYHNNDYDTNTHTNADVINNIDYRAYNPQKPGLKAKSRVKMQQFLVNDIKAIENNNEEQYHNQYDAQEQDNDNDNNNEDIAEYEDEKLNYNENQYVDDESNYNKSDNNNNIKPIRYNNYQEREMEQSPNIHDTAQQQIQVNELNDNNNNISNYSFHSNKKQHSKRKSNTRDNTLFQRDSPCNQNYILSTQNQVNTNYNTAITHQTTFPQMEIMRNDQFDFLPKQQNKKTSIQQQKPTTPTKKQNNPPFYNHSNNLNDFDLSMISKKAGVSSDSSFYTQVDSNKLYSKRKKAEINMSRGMLIQNRAYKLEHKNLMIPYLKLLQPTQPIAVVSNNEIIKYQIISSTSNTNIKNKSKPKTNVLRARIEPEPAPESLSLFTNQPDNALMPYITSQRNQTQQQDNDYQRQIQEQLQPQLQQEIKSYKSQRSKKPKAISNISMTQADKSLINQTESSLRKNLIRMQMDIECNDTIPVITKNKIYLWLIDVGILKDKSIAIQDIPNICINGVLLCDLVNRCEGRNECIHGIIRKTTTKSQIQVNVNKVLVHLRSIEKFSSRHLWSHNEIVQGNGQVIWELLEDLYEFYSIKTKFVSRSKSKPKVTNTLLQQGQETQDQSILTQDPLVNSNLNEVLPFENNHYPTPLNNHRANSNQHYLNRIPKQMIKVPSFSNLKTESNKKRVSMPRCNTHNNIYTNSNTKPNYFPLLTKNGIQSYNNHDNSSNNISVIQKHNQSFQSQIPHNNNNNLNLNGFLLFEKSAVKRLKQNIAQISELNITHQ